MTAKEGSGKAEKAKIGNFVPWMQAKRRWRKNLGIWSDFGVI